jgi:ribosomal protein S18 acetylase RimI-like enzyme
MVVERVTSRRGFDELLEAFPNPELTRRRLDAEHEPFWRHASRELFVLRDGRRVIGRIAAIADAAHDAAHADGRGFFGWLDCPDDPDAARALCEAAAQWLRERGYRVARGPLHLGLGEAQGAILEGFDPRPDVLSPGNPSYLPVLLGKVGMRVVHERHGYAWDREEVPAPPASLRRSATGDVVYRNLDPAHHGAEALRFLAAYNAAHAQRWGFVPMREDEARARLRDVLGFGDPRLVWLAEVRGEPAGVVVAMPVLADGAIAPLRRTGRLAGLRALREAIRGRELLRVHLVDVAVDPRFRDLHVGAQLLLRAWRAALDLGVREAELSGVDAEDESMHQLLWRLGCRRLRRYGVYELALR